MTDAPATLSHQVLADPTGRRRRRLALVGRVAATLLGLWLVVLTLGGLGLQPLAGIPVVGDLGTGGGAPPALPKRVQSATKRGHVVRAPHTAGAPVTSRPAPSRRPAVRAPAARPKTGAPAAQRTPGTAPGRSKTTPGRAPASTAPVPAQPSPTTKAPTTPPGQTRTAPGQTRTAPGPSTTTPHGNTPQGGPR